LAQENKQRIRWLCRDRQRIFSYWC